MAPFYLDYGKVFISIQRVGLDCLLDNWNFSNKDVQIQMNQKLETAKKFTNRS